MTQKQLKALNEVLNYLWQDEEKDFKANGEPKEHIFNDLVVLDHYMQDAGEGRLS